MQERMQVRERGLSKGKTRGVVMHHNAATITVCARRASDAIDWPGLGTKGMQERTQVREHGLSKGKAKGGVVMHPACTTTPPQSPSA